MRRERESTRRENEENREERRGKARKEVITLWATPIKRGLGCLPVILKRTAKGYQDPCGSGLIFFNP